MDLLYAFGSVDLHFLVASLLMQFSGICLACSVGFQTNKVCVAMLILKFTMVLCFREL